MPVPIVVEYSIGSSIGGSALASRLAAAGSVVASREAVAVAGAADVAVVFVNDVTSEGMDRTDARRCRATRTALIAAVAAANPRTIVVLHTAGPVLMPWLDDVAAVIQAWYPGQETGRRDRRRALRRRSRRAGG